jgi:hypothetical protein
MIACGGSGTKGQKDKQPAPVPPIGTPADPKAHVLSEFTYPMNAKREYGHELLEFYKIHPKRFKDKWLKNKNLLIDRHLDLGLLYYDSHIAGSKIRVFKQNNLTESSILSTKLSQDHSFLPEFNAKEFRCNFDNMFCIFNSQKYEYKSNEAYVDFAAKKLGGGVLGRGFVQEEIMVMESNLLPLVAATKLKASGANTCPELPLKNLDKHPVVIQGRRFLEVTGQDEIYGRLLEAKAPFDAEQHLRLCQNPIDIYLTAMAAPDFHHASKGKTYTQADLSALLTLAVRGFYDTMMAQHGDHNPLIIHTGNWGCGAFGNSRQTIWVVQRLAIEAAYNLFRQTTGASSRLEFHCNAYDDAGLKAAHEANQAFARDFPNGLTLEEYGRLLFAKTQADAAWQVR